MVAITGRPKQARLLQRLPCRQRLHRRTRCVSNASDGERSDDYDFGDVSFERVSQELPRPELPGRSRSIPRARAQQL
jgi:hypothetical protein